MSNLLKGASFFWVFTIVACQWSTNPANPSPFVFPTDPLNTFPNPTQSRAAFGNVKTIANDGATAGTIDIYYEYYSSPFAQALYDPDISATNPETTKVLTLQSLLSCVGTCTLGDVLDGGESLSTKDILVAGVSNSNSNMGAAYVFKDIGFRFSQQAELIPRDGASNDYFGSSVAVDEFNPRKVLIGSPNDDDRGTESGSAYMFESSPTGKYWTEGQKLLGAGTVAGDRFGTDVDIMGRTAVVSAPGASSNFPGYDSNTASSCELYLFEQEKPKPPPPPPPKCHDEDDDNSSPSSKSSLRGAGEASILTTDLPSADDVIRRSLSRTVSPFADIKQTKTLQWSQQQILHDSIFMDDCQGDLQISLYENNLVVGIQFYDHDGTASGKDAGVVLSFDMHTFKGPCTSNIFPTMLSFSELVEMRDSATRTFWEEWGKQDHSDSDCKPKPGPKPVPMCEVSRWSMNQYLRPPVVSNCSYYGSAVDVYGDVMVVQERGYDHIGGVSNCIEDGDNGYGDGMIYIYRKVDGKWSQRQQISPYSLAAITSGSANRADFGNSIKITGTDIYAGYLADDSNAYTQVYTVDNTYECAVFSLGDHFGDGWNGAELVITQPDGRSERYAPYCTSVDSGSAMLGQFFRWCPHNQSHCGEITVEIPRAEDFPFHWEILWGVYMEETDVWVYGDYRSKMVFNWDCDRKDLSLVSATHVINNGTCVSNCQRFQPTPRPTPAKPPPAPKDDVLPPTPLPSAVPTGDSSKRLLQSSSEGGVQEEPGSGSWLDLTAPDEALRGAAQGLGPEMGTMNSHVLRKLPKSGGSHTQHPTFSPAPTLLVTGDPGYQGHYEYITLKSSSGNVDWYAPFGRSTKWYLTDIHGKHLIASGTKCSEDAANLYCWLDLPDNGEFILRIGGNENPGSGVHSAQFCHRDLVRGSQLTFRINNHQCTPLSYYTTSRYCSSYLKLVTAIHGVALLSGIHVNTLTSVDKDILSSVFSSIYGSLTGVEVQAVAESSSQGTVVTFELYLDIQLFGYDKEDYEAVDIVPQIAQNTLSNSFETGTFAGLLDMAISSASLRGHTSSFKGHGAVELRLMSGGEFLDRGPSASAQLDPISFVTSEKQGSADGFSAWFDWPAFLGILCVGVVVLVVVQTRRRTLSQGEEGGEGGWLFMSETVEKVASVGGRLYAPVAMSSEHGGNSSHSSRSSSSKSTSSSKKRSSSKDSSSSEVSCDVCILCRHVLILMCRRHPSVDTKATPNHAAIGAAAGLHRRAALPPAEGLPRVATPVVILTTSPALLWRIACCRSRLSGGRRRRGACSAPLPGAMPQCTPMMTRQSLLTWTLLSRCLRTVLSTPRRKSRLCAGPCVLRVLEGDCDILLRGVYLSELLRQIKGVGMCSIEIIPRFSFTL